MIKYIKNINNPYFQVNYQWNVRFTISNYPQISLNDYSIIKSNTNSPPNHLNKSLPTSYNYIHMALNITSQSEATNIYISKRKWIKCLWLDQHYKSWIKHHKNKHKYLKAQFKRKWKVLNNNKKYKH